LGLTRCVSRYRIELGAGSGLVGLAVARGCSTDSTIYITDQECMLPLMKDNIDINGLSSNVKAIMLDWGSPLPDCISHSPTVVLAADCVYFEPAFPLLISTLQQLLSPDSICYFCFKRRRRADLRFMKQAKKIFDVVEIRGYMDRDNFARENLFLYSIRPRSAKDNTALPPDPC
jgi:protein N-lysine methyltransferase METTL21A